MCLIKKSKVFGSMQGFLDLCFCLSPNCQSHNCALLKHLLTSVVPVFQCQGFSEVQLSTGQGSNTEHSELS